ncbi:membrane protease subunit HflC [Allopseudospirillum japonicum]|uniref:Protein HflC n=1 Tax=Allopseudospirillum japonicum TaxID=64971 RepID=A0A1H6QRH0_9GAMM|nr:protease modulator HflC [Allopseudospirillum japonicum]SEI41572.1 membrane protease subunit HflC [Allopseudospirillum japonicum]
MNSRSIVGLTLIALVAWIGSSSLYIVNATERAIKLQFGQIVESNIEPGLHYRVPVYQTIRKFDTRVLTLDSRPQRYLTKEKKAVIVDSFVKWKIVDVTRYYEATSGDELTAARLIAPRVDESLRNEFGRRDLSEIISEKRDELMTKAITELSKVTQSELGITLLDIRVKRIDLPTEVSSAVYERMKSERQREAREYRAQGKEESEKIRAAADRERQVLLAQAYEEAEQIKGQGDAQAAAVYAQAFQRDPEFFRFHRSLQAYRESFNNKGDVLVLEPDSDFFKYLKEAQGTRVE